MSPLRTHSPGIESGSNPTWELYALANRRREEHAIPNGYALAFARSPEGRRDREALREVFLAAHPSFRASTSGTRNSEGLLWLSLEGPAGASSYLRELLASAAQVQARADFPWHWRLRRATAWLRRLPDFLILGAARCGTTSLYHWLGEHPNVTRAWHKEVGFFDRSFTNGLAWYRAHFPLKFGPQRQTGEATPEYLYHPRAPERIRATLPDVKLIVLLRNPVERAHSHHQLLVRNRLETLPFDQALAREDERIASELERIGADETYAGLNWQHYSYRSRGEYADQLRRWFEYFPRDRFLILEMDALARKPDETLARILVFLDLPVGAPRVFERRHTMPRAPLDEGVRRSLQAHFEPHNRRLFELLGEDFGWTP